MNQRKNFTKTRKAVSRRNLRKIKKFYQTFSLTPVTSIPNDYLEVVDLEERRAPDQSSSHILNPANATETIVRDHSDLDSDANSDDDNLEIEYSVENEIRAVDNIMNDTNVNLFEDNRDDHNCRFANVNSAQNSNGIGAMFNVQNNLSSNIYLIPTRRSKVEEHIVCVVAMSLRHHTSYESVLDTFRYTNLSFETDLLPTTKAALWRALDRNNSHILKYYYCRECNDYLGLKSSATNQLEHDCCCKVCGPGKPETKLGYFLYNNLTAQIQQLLAMPNIIKALKYRFQRKIKNCGVLEDIYDGAEYQKLSSSGILKEWYNFSLTFNTDGAQTANSANTSIWPIFAQINELPPHMRKCHMLLAAVYVDSKHPVMNNFLRPFIEELTKLYQNEIVWDSPDGTQITSKVIVTTSSLDAPARAAVTRLTQFNGYFGCLFCYARGETVKPKKLVYPIDKSSRKLRKKSELIADMHEAFETGEVVNGVKGISSLIALPIFDISKGVVVEALHAIYHGVVRQHTTLLLLKTKEPYYIGSPTSRHIIDQHLLSIKPPSRRSRKPRSISTFSQWKASEWRNWLDYAPICLQDVLDRKYLNHISLLSEAVYYLNNDSVTLSELDRAEKLLKKYVELFQNYFGVENMSSNVHSLCHIVQTVRSWGPIWAHSSFVFESWNKNLLDHMTSSHCKAEQIITRFLMEKYLMTCLFKDSIPVETRKFIQKTNKIPLFSDEIELLPKFHGQGKSLARSPTADELLALSVAGYSTCSFTSFKKMICNGIKYCCENKNEKIKYCNSIICDSNGTYGKIQSIVQFHYEGETINGLFMFPFLVIGFAFNAKHIKRLKPCRDLIFISQIAAIEPACLIKNSMDTYIFKLANCWESD